MNKVNAQEVIAEVADYVLGMWRYRWSALGVGWLISFAGWIYVYTMPDLYQASAKVFVDTNSLLRPLLQGLTAQQDPLDEAQLVSKAVLTRPNLEEVAHKTDLTLSVETPQQLESLVTRLQQSIGVAGGRDNIFEIRYQDTSRQKSVGVVAAVLDTFVENAIGNQGDDAAVTERALASEIHAHEERLLAAESALGEFKKENLGYMPNEAGDYYTRLQAALATEGRTEQQVRLLTERRDELRRQIQGEEPVFGSMLDPVLMPGGVSCSQSAHLSELEAELSTLLVRYTQKHPRVLALLDTIASLEQGCTDEQAFAAASSSTGVTAPPSLEVNPVYQSLRIQASNADVELAALRAELEARRDEVARLRRDVDKIVEVETELKQLNRDYGVVQGRHQELLRRWEDLQAKKRLDPMTDRVQFRRIEPPFALAEPVGPNRPLLLGVVFVLAMGAGTALAFGLNAINPAFFTRRSLKRAVELPLLGSVSLILTPREKSSRRSNAMLWSGAYVLLVVATAIVMYFAAQGSQLLRSVLSGAGA